MFGEAEIIVKAEEREGLRKVGFQLGSPGFV